MIAGTSLEMRSLSTRIPSRSRAVSNRKVFTASLSASADGSIAGMADTAVARHRTATTGIADDMFASTRSVPSRAVGSKHSAASYTKHIALPEPDLDFLLVYAAYHFVSCSGRHGPSTLLSARVLFLFFKRILPSSSIDTPRKHERDDSAGDVSMAGRVSSSASAASCSTACLLLLLAVPCCRRYPFSSPFRSATASCASIADALSTSWLIAEPIACADDGHVAAVHTTAR